MQPVSREGARQLSFAVQLPEGVRREVCEKLADGGVSWVDAGQGGGAELMIGWVGGGDRSGWAMCARVGGMAGRRPGVILLSPGVVDEETREISLRLGAAAHLGWPEAGELLCETVRQWGREEAAGGVELGDSLELMRLLTGPASRQEIVETVLDWMQRWSGCEVAAIRLKSGGEYRYAATRGMDAELRAAEDSLCTAGGEGPECFCGAVLTGTGLVGLPGVTAGGSLHANEGAGLVERLPKELMPGGFRGRCAAAGYQTFALIPLRLGEEITGLVQLADRRADRIPEGVLAFLEGAASSLAMALEQRRAEEALKASEAKLRVIADHTPDLECWCDIEGRLVWINPGVEALTGYTPEECLAMPDYPLPLVHPDWREKIAAHYRQAVGGGAEEGLEFVVRRKDGGLRWCEVSLHQVMDASGKWIGHRASIQNIDRRKRTELLLEGRLRLNKVAERAGLQEILRATLDEAERLTHSRIGFYHFLGADQNTLTLQQWSTRTTAEMCKAEGSGMHYPVEQAGVWVDCIRERRPVIHNDYASLGHRKGLPEGHAAVVRELVVPVMRGGLVVAILGVGNKEADYDEADVEAVMHFADFAWDVVELKRAAERLRASERNHRELIEKLPAGVMVVEGGEVLSLNAEGARILGFKTSGEALEGGLASMLGEDSVASMERRSRELLEGRGGEVTGEERWRRRDGSVFEAETALARVTFEGSPAVLIVFRDITDRRQLEAAYHQAQKMESLGRLAGGVAHDFNNLLTIINGYSGMLLGKRHDVGGQTVALEQIRQAGERAAELVRQMLAFSRKQVQHREVLEVNAVVGGVAKMLARLLGEDIVVELDLDEGAGAVLADRHQLEQVVVNLAVNARDAMPEGGRFLIRTRRIVHGGGVCGRCRERIQPGDYVEMTFGDSGPGLSEEARQHLFEPFFTTKGPGKGTGLGLAMVQGIVSQSGGHVDVDTAPGLGARFQVLLPLHGAEKEVGVRAGAEAGRGSETVLLVEDQEEVRRFVAEALGQYGYTVLEAASGVEAEAMAEGRRLDLVLSDVVMPGMRGPQLAERLMKRDPGLKVLLISGYADGVTGMPLIQKPFSPAQLNAQIRRLLDGDGRGGIPVE